MQMTIKHLDFRKISKIRGKGTFIFDKFKREAPFTIEFYIGREALVFMDVSFFSKFDMKLSKLHLHKQKYVEASLFGELEDGYKIHIDKLILIATTGLNKSKSTPVKFKAFSPIIISKEDLKPVKGKTEIRYYITNFEFTGCEKTMFPKGGGKLDHFTISIDGYTFCIKKLEKYNRIIETIKKNKTSSITAEIIVKVDFKERERISSIIDNICNLLSFATGNTVVPVTEEHLLDGKVVWAQTNSMKVYSFRSGDQLIPLLPPETIREFIIKAYPNYSKWKKKLGLNILIDYYLLMKSNPVLDVRCLLGYVLLECLSSHAQEFYAKKGEPIESSIKKSQIKKFNKSLPKSNNLSKRTKERIVTELFYQFPSLQDSIQKLMKDFGMKYKKGEIYIWKLRKEFIHKGMFPKNTGNRIKIYRDIVHFIDRLMLHILNYDGEFLNIADGYKTEKLDFKDENHYKH